MAAAPNTIFGWASARRLLVERPVRETVVEALRGAVAHIPVGDPFTEGTVVGPMAGPRHLTKVRSFLEQAANAPVQVVSGPEPGGAGGARTAAAAVRRTA